MVMIEMDSECHKIAAKMVVSLVLLDFESHSSRLGSVNMLRITDTI